MLILTLVIAAAEPSGSWTVAIDKADVITVSHDGQPEVRVPASDAGAHPHSARLVDVDGDGALDVIAYDGEKQTLVYLRRGNVLTLVFRDVSSFASVVDLDGDGKPELILGTGAGDDGCAFDQHGLAEARAYLQTRSIIHAGDDRSDSEAAYQLKLHQPIVIASWSEGMLRETTAKYQQFLRWRLAFQTEQVKTADMGCASYFAELAAKTDKLLKRK